MIKTQTPKTTIAAMEKAFAAAIAYWPGRWSASAEASAYGFGKRRGAAGKFSPNEWALTIDWVSAMRGEPCDGAVLLARAEEMSLKKQRAMTTKRPVS